MSVGTSLQELRAKAGLSIAELAKRTRIPSSVLEDLEQDKFSTSGGPAYARGHIRTIARICNVDASPILAQFESQTIPLSKSIRDLLNDTSVTKAKPERKPLSWKALSGITAGVVLAGLIFTSMFSGGSKTEITSPNPSSSSSSDGAVAMKRKGVEIVLTAVNGLSWVKVSDSTGNDVYSGRINQGESRTFEDNQLLKVVIGNAGAIRVSYNNVDQGIVGNVGEVVRLEYASPTTGAQG